MKKIDRDRCIVYDVEIAKEVDDVPGKWTNPGGMGFASAVAYEYATDRYHFFMHEDDRPALLELLNTKIAVTFNGVKFDSCVILGNNRKTRMVDGLTFISGTDVHWRDYDILLEYVRARFDLDNVKQAEKKLGQKGIHDGSFNLDALCRKTLGYQKSGHGAHAPILYKQKEYAALLEYNLQDVRLTRFLFDFIWDNGFVIDGHDRVVRL